MTTPTTEQMVDYKTLRKAFGSLMGINGDRYVEEIATTGILSKQSYDIISENTSYNGQESLIEHFGIVQAYYIKGVQIARNKRLQPHEDIF
jgi:hypothetical protein